MALASGTWRLLLVDDEPALRGGRVAVPRTAGQEGPALLTVNGRLGLRRGAVRLVAYDEVPANTVVMTAALAGRAGLAESGGWRIDAWPTATLTSLTLEATTEERADLLQKAVHDDTTLVGQCLWSGEDTGATVLELGEREFRVAARDENPGQLMLWEVGPNTAVDLFLPGARTGLDVVVLADCSGSMQVDDLPVDREQVRWRGAPSYRTRLDALKEALGRMLDARLRVSGRESRIALVRFADESQQCYPVGGGMAALDSTSPPSDIEEFRGAVQRLDAGGSTHIALALVRAAEILSRWGKPDNDRLVVLVSDGRPWVPSKADATGEVVADLDDPVSCVSSLRSSHRILLHAVGISNNDLFEAWLRRTGHPPNQLLRPDHPLLEKLVEVGGGDPTRIGGIDVLERYFSDLGSGLTRRIGRPAAPQGRPRLSEQVQRLLATSAQGQQDECREAVERLRISVPMINDYARRLAGSRLGDWLPFDRTDRMQEIFDNGLLELPVRGEPDFGFVLRDLHQIAVERGPGRQHVTSRPEILAEIYECFSDIAGQIKALHAFVNQDRTSGSPHDQRVVESGVRVLRRHVNDVRIDPGDAPRWSVLRHRLVVGLADAAEAALTRAEAVGRTMPTAPVDGSGTATRTATSVDGTTMDDDAPSEDSPGFDLPGLRIRD